MSPICPVSSRQTDEAAVRGTAFLVLGTVVLALFAHTGFLLALLAAGFLIRGFLSLSISPLSAAARLVVRRMGLVPRLQGSHLLWGAVDRTQVVDLVQARGQYLGLHVGSQVHGIGAQIARELLEQVAKGHCRILPAWPGVQFFWGANLRHRLDPTEGSDHIVFTGIMCVPIRRAQNSP